MINKQVVSTILLVICALLLYGCGSVEIGILPSPTPTPSTLRFEETEYGFAFNYQSNWQVEAQPHRVTVSRGTLTLNIAYKGVDEAQTIDAPTNIPADGSISLGKLLFLQKAMPS